MNEMIEQVARALVDARPQGRGWEAESALGKRNARDHARAVIIAMREPTEKMLDAADNEATFTDIRWIWQAMIDAALEETT